MHACVGHLRGAEEEKTVVVAVTVPKLVFSWTETVNAVSYGTGETIVEVLEAGNWMLVV